MQRQLVMRYERSNYKDCDIPKLNWTFFRLWHAYFFGAVNSNIEWGKIWPPQRLFFNEMWLQNVSILGKVKNLTSRRYITSRHTTFLISRLQTSATPITFSVICTEICRAGGDFPIIDNTWHFIKLFLNIPCFLWLHKPSNKCSK